MQEAIAIQKILFSLMAKRITSYLLANNYCDTSRQKAGVPRFLSCVEYLAIIWEQIQSAKGSRSDLHVVWLDLANAYRSVLHQLTTFAPDFVYIPSHIQSLEGDYFKNVHVCHASQEISS